MSDFKLLVSVHYLDRENIGLGYVNVEKHSVIYGKN
jgi:hypothetical protein